MADALAKKKRIRASHKASATKTTRQIDLGERAGASPPSRAEGTPLYTSRMPSIVGERELDAYVE